MTTATTDERIAIAQQFFQSIHGDGLDGDDRDLYISLFRKEGKQTFWAKSPEEAARTAVAASETSDIWMGVGLSPDIFMSKQLEAQAKVTGVTPPWTDRRCPSSKVACIPGLWLDLDIASDNIDIHKRANYPPSVEAALQFMEDTIPLPPTWVIHSGHGLQCWWVFKEPEYLFDADARKEMANLSFQWNSTWRARAADRGWTVDATHDLARILRIPGTTNRKVESEIVPVTVVSFDDDARFDISEFEPYLIDIAQAPVAPPSGGECDANFVLRAGAMPPAEKFSALSVLDQNFSDSWGHRREDMKDASQSEYDMSLASFAVEAGWTDQEIADLLVANRRFHGADLKLRVSYYASTIRRARSSSDSSIADESIQSIADAIRTNPDGADVDMIPSDEIFKSVSTQIGLPVRGLIHVESEPSEYYLVLDGDRRYRMGGINCITEFSRFRNILADHTGHLIKRVKTKEWDSIVTVLLKAQTYESLGEEATLFGAMKGWLRQYLELYPPVDSPEEGCASSFPYDKGDDRIYLFAGALKTWITKAIGEKVDSKDVFIRLKGLGGLPFTEYVSVSGKRTSRSVWGIPKEVFK